MKKKMQYNTGFIYWRRFYSYDNYVYCMKNTQQKHKLNA